MTTRTEEKTDALPEVDTYEQRRTIFMDNGLRLNAYTRSDGAALISMKQSEDHDTVTLWESGQGFAQPIGQAIAKEDVSVKG